MRDAVTKMLKLGKVSVENELDFADALSELPNNLTLEEAEALLNIFEVDDDDDHSAFAWMWLDFMKRVDGLDNSKVLRNSKTFWVKLLAYSLEKTHSSRYITPTNSTRSFLIWISLLIIGGYILIMVIGLI